MTIEEQASIKTLISTVISALQLVQIFFLPLNIPSAGSYLITPALAWAEPRGKEAAILPAPHNRASISFKLTF